MKTVFVNKKSPQKPFFMIWGQKKFFEIVNELKIDTNDLFKINNEWYNNY